MNPEWNANTVKYYEKWYHVLRVLNHHSEEASVNGATSLANNRIDCVKNGMPDLDPDIDQSIMSRAFEIHKDFCSHKDDLNWRPGSLAPPWSRDPKTKTSTPVCNCYYTALGEWYAGGKLPLDPIRVPAEPVKEIEVPVDEFSFERMI